MQLGRNDAATLRSQGSGLGAFSPASPTVSTGQRRAAEDSASPVWEGNAAPMQPAATMQTSPDFMVQQHLQQTSSHASVETGQLQPQQPQPPNQQQEEQQEQQQGVPGPVEVCCLGDSLMRVREHARAVCERRLVQGRSTVSHQPLAACSAPQQAFCLPAAGTYAYLHARTCSAHLQLPVFPPFLTNILAPDLAGLAAFLALACSGP